METFSAYARHFIGNIERPDVDSINGLSPVISIEQKTTNKNPRSTVGTVTEIYDFVRLLYARIGVAYSHVSGEKMVKYTEEQILNLITEKYDGKDIMILAPLVKGRKGHYRELFSQVAKKGFLRVRVDGEVRELTYNMQVDRYKTHDIELVGVPIESCQRTNMVHMAKLLKAIINECKAVPFMGRLFTVGQFDSPPCSDLYISSSSFLYSPNRS